MICSNCGKEVEWEGYFYCKDCAEGDVCKRCVGMTRDTILAIVNMIDAVNGFLNHTLLVFDNGSESGKARTKLLKNTAIVADRIAKEMDLENMIGEINNQFAWVIAEAKGECE